MTRCLQGNRNSRSTVDIVDRLKKTEDNAAAMKIGRKTVQLLMVAHGKLKPGVASLLEETSPQRWTEHNDVKRKKVETCVNQ